MLAKATNATTAHCSSTQAPGIPNAFTTLMRDKGYASNDNSLVDIFFSALPLDNGYQVPIQMSATGDLNGGCGSNVLIIQGATCAPVKLDSTFLIRFCCILFVELATLGQTMKELPQPGRDTSYPQRMDDLVGETEIWTLRYMQNKVSPQDALLYLVAFGTIRLTVLRDTYVWWSIIYSNATTFVCGEEIKGGLLRQLRSEIVDLQQHVLIVRDSIVSGRECQPFVKQTNVLDDPEPTADVGIGMAPPYGVTTVWCLQDPATQVTTAYSTASGPPKMH